MTIYKGVVLGILRYAAPVLSRRLMQAQKRRLTTAGHEGIKDGVAQSSAGASGSDLP